MGLEERMGGKCKLQMVTNKTVYLLTKTCERHHHNIFEMDFLESEVCVDKKMSGRKS